MSNEFEHASDANLQVRASSIVASLTGNPNFADPRPDLATVTAALENFSTALTNAQGGAYTDIGDKNQKREELINLLQRLGEYVVFTAAGDAAKAATTAYVFAKDHSDTPAISRPENLILEDGPNSGELYLHFNRVKNARSYIYQCTLDPVSENSVWESHVGTISKMVFTNLQKGKRYWCRVGAVGSNQTIFSDAVSRMVQ